MTSQDNTSNPYESVVVHWRWRPTGDEGELVTIHGRKDAQDYVDAILKEQPNTKYEYWLTAIKAAS